MNLSQCDISKGGTRLRCGRGQEEGEWEGLTVLQQSAYDYSSVVFHRPWSTCARPEPFECEGSVDLTDTEAGRAKLEDTTKDPGVLSLSPRWGRLWSLGMGKGWEGS